LYDPSKDIFKPYSHIFLEVVYRLGNALDMAIEGIMQSRIFVHLPSPNPGLDEKHIDTPDDHYVCLYYINDSEGDTIIFDDNGEDLVCGTADPAITGTIKPAQSLASSAGKSSLGTWLLVANDNTFQNGGTFTSGSLDGATITVCTAEANTSVPTFSSSTISITANGTTVFTASDMTASSDSETAEQQTYTIVVAPTKGEIIKNGVALSTGGTFTQADIDAGNVAYSNTQTSLFNDQFKVDITNSLNGWLANQEINLEATSLSTNSFELSNLSVYPNPSNGLINVSFQTTSNDAVEIVLFDLQGRKVFRSKQNSNNQSMFNQSINTRTLSNGIYLLRAIQGNRSTTKRVIISK